MTPEVEKEFAETSRFFCHDAQVSGITGDCGQGGREKKKKKNWRWEVV